MNRFLVHSPADDRVVYEGAFADSHEVETSLAVAVGAGRGWRETSLGERIQGVRAWLDAIDAKRELVATELTAQMGRPISQSPGEIAGFLDRGRTLARLAEEALIDVALPQRDGFTRFLRREPLGVVLVLSPWNYPWLTAVNAVAAALLAGNAVLLKHAEQTPRVAERMTEAWASAGLPAGVFQHLHLTHERVAEVVADARIGAVSFTGSVAGGQAISRAAGGRFLSVGYELGGKDAAYVRSDADVARAAAHIVDGGMYNAGQSCCAVERVYVHEDVYSAFVDAATEEVKKLRVGDPAEAGTSLGPLVRARNADAVRAQVDAALASGARRVVEPVATLGLPQYLAPDLLVDVAQDMALMQEETFGPALGVLSVGSDDEAIAHINDSRYGLTASIWTPDLDRALALGDRLEVGTVFMNRADYLDPELAWTGVRDSGRGCTLSRFGFDAFTRWKSFHLRHRIP